MEHTYTCFRVCGDKETEFKWEDFCDFLGVKPDQVLVKGEKNELTSKKNTFTTIYIGMNDLFDYDINKMTRRTFNNLFGKEKLLLELKIKYRLNYYLERVVFLNASGGVNPVLSMDIDIINFMSKAEVEDELDYYVE